MSKSEATWPALDLLRGTAAVLMIANHAAVRWCDPADANWASSAAFWSGGLAPVLFFFATGFGYGVQHSAGSSGEPHRFGFLRKVVVLCVADAFATWVWPGSRFHIDFLGFIGASMLVLQPLRGARRGPALASGLLFVVLTVRFGLSPLIAGLGGDPAAWAAFTGRAPVAWSSYPPFPWLAFPLLGFVLGAAAERLRGSLRLNAVALGALACALVAFAASAALVRVGFPLQRYGTMSLAYFPFALGGVAVVASAALAWQTRPPGALARALALRGLASLVLVPVHYWLLSALRPLVAEPSAGAFLATLTGAVIAALAISRWLAGRATHLGPSASRWGAACFVAGALAAALLNLAALPPGAARAAVAYSGQIAVCLLLVLPLRPLRVPRSALGAASGIS